MTASGKTYYTNFLTMLSGNTLSQVIPFLIAPVLARIFTPEEFAVQANFLAIVGVIGIVATGRLELAIPLPKEKKEAQDIVFTGLSITILLGLLSVLLAVFSFQISQLYGDQRLAGYLWLAPLGVISYGLLGLTTNWSLRNEKFKNISISKVGQSIVNNGLAAALGFWGWGINGLIVAWLLSQYVNVLILLIGVRRDKTYTTFSLLTIKRTLKKYKDFPLINSLHAFSDIFITQFLFFWVISDCFGLRELGLFAMMHKYVKAPIVLVSSSVSQLFYVEAGKAINEKRSVLPIFKRTIKTSLLFAIPFTVVLLIFAPLIFQWYLGDTWQQAGVYARCLAPSLLLYFMLSPVSGIPILFNQQRKAFVISVIGNLVSVIGLVLAFLFGADFEYALWCYAGGFSLFYVVLLRWYYSILVKHAHTH